MRGGAGNKKWQLDLRARVYDCRPSFSIQDCKFHPFLAFLQPHTNKSNSTAHAKWKQQPRYLDVVVVDELSLVGPERPLQLRYLETGGSRPVILHRFKSTNDVMRHANASTNGVRRDASGWAAPGAPAVVSGRAQWGGDFVALL